MADDAIKLKPRLDPARAELAATETQIIELKAKRQQQLLAGEPVSLIAKIDAEIARQEHTRRTEADRIALLEAEARKLEAEAAERRRVAHVVRFSKLLDQADDAALELQATVKLADELFRKVIRLREEAAALFDVRSSHAQASKNNHEGAALSGGAVHALLRYEIFRVGSRSNPGGVAGAAVEQSFPGGLSPRIDQQLRPESVVPFVDTLRKASAFAINLLQAELVPSAAAVTAAEQPARTPAQEKLGRLLARQAQLAAAEQTDATEAEYQNVVKQIAAAQAEVTEGGR